jgi:hypothetical protein
MHKQDRANSGLLRLWSVFALVISLAFNAIAVEHSGCLHGALSAVIDPIDETMNVQFYKDFDSILFLNDGPYYPSGTMNQAQVVNAVYPEKKIVWADTGTHGEYNPEPNLRAIHLDPQAKFPFEANAFDAVTMWAGKIDSNEKIVVEFFGEVARVLNKKKPSAVAILHGGIAAHDDEVIDVWRKAAEEVMRRYPVRITLGFNKSGFYRGYFDAVLIQPVEALPVEQVLKEKLGK